MKIYDETWNELTEPDLSLGRLDAAGLARYVAAGRLTEAQYMLCCGTNVL